MAARRIGIEVAEELVAAGLERSDIDRDLAAARYHFLAMKLDAFEFLGRSVEILDHQRDLLTRGNLELGGLEAVLPDGEGITRPILAAARRDAERQRHDRPKECRALV